MLIVMLVNVISTQMVIIVQAPYLMLDIIEVCI